MRMTQSATDNCHSFDAKADLHAKAEVSGVPRYWYAGWRPDENATLVYAGTHESGQEPAIGSIKSNFGHHEAATGFSGSMKVVLALEHGIILSNHIFVNPNPNKDFAASRVRATHMAIKWPQTSLDVRRASVKSFGFCGSNALIIVITSDFFGDDENDGEVVVAEYAPPKVLVLSANDQQSLNNCISAISENFINPNVAVDLDDLAYALDERRSHHCYRAFLISHSSSSRDQEQLHFGQKAVSKPRVGSFFTGQGAQWSQMEPGLVKASHKREKWLRN
ncbi:highly reducing polyketide synthase ATR6 [Colletotrichum spaethianum]|uniref:Highly reducing polyketide synthase ATR6 n=1 Tax=Colletotrichum spaethianum TaxID=700344 RepID=A0AA37P8V6_9PEZI|nr:highly reducing polyketide synthase ATR6 [Colletotrichum spaethianum]GKT47782.1 highly reducing polyketide synthase ATR6 [Colletotrichum spaethianum]